MAYIHDLLAEVRCGNLTAADELADFVEHALEQPKRRVASAFGLVNRGGDQRRPQRAVRDEMIRASSSRLPFNMPVEQKLREIERDRDLLQNVLKTGLGIPGRRQLRNIIEAEPLAG